jgi:hypothetical protein
MTEIVMMIRYLIDHATCNDKNLPVYEIIFAQKAGVGKLQNAEWKETARPWAKA